jgi:flagellar biosynthesis/type III secretory pathway ATPase
MKKSIYEAQRLSDLESELLNAIENREVFIEVGDYNMVSAWDEQIDMIVEHYKKLEQ